jgi:hypothetical protein
MKRLREERLTGMRRVPKRFQSASQPSTVPSPGQIGGIVIVVRHGKTDTSSGPRFGHEDFRAGIGPDADRRGEFERTQDASFVARGGDGSTRAARLVIGPGRFPSVNVRPLGEKMVNRARGGTAEHVNVEFFLCAPQQRQTHHRVAEVMEFDDKQAGFHRANQRRLSM